MTVAVALGDAPILVVDAQLSPLISADLPGVVDRLLLRFKVTRRAIATATPNIPAAIGSWHNMMRFRAFASHLSSPTWYDFVRYISNTPVRLSRSKSFGIHRTS